MEDEEKMQKMKKFFSSPTDEVFWKTAQDWRTSSDLQSPAPLVYFVHPFLEFINTLYKILKQPHPKVLLRKVISNFRHTF